MDTVKHMHVVALSNERHSNSAAIRLGKPLQVLAAEQQIVLRLLSFHQCTHADLRWGDVFIIQRGINERMLTIMQRIKKMNKPVIYEIDDLITQLPGFLQDHDTMRMHHDFVVSMIAMADAVSTTTARLAAQLAPINPNVHLVPNYAVPGATAVARHQSAATPQATLVLAASDTVQTDFLLPALQQVQARYGTAVELVCIGAIARSISIPGMVVHSYPILPQPRFVEVIAALVNPIGLIPLDDSLFSSCKTAIKYLDYAVSGIPSICSDVSPYREVVTDQDTGLLVENTTARWVEALCLLIDSPALRERLCDNAIARVREHHQLAHTAQAWHRVLGSVCKAPQASASRGLLASAHDAWLDARDRITVLLRETNRARLLRRKAAKSQIHPIDSQ